MSELSLIGCRTCRPLPPLPLPPDEDDDGDDDDQQQTEQEEAVDQQRHVGWTLPWGILQRLHLKLTRLTRDWSTVGMGGTSIL